MARDLWDKLEELHESVIEVVLERIKEEEEEMVYDANGVGTPTGKQVRLVDNNTLALALKLLQQNKVTAKKVNIDKIGEMRKKLADRKQKKLMPVEDSDERTGRDGE